MSNYQKSRKIGLQYRNGTTLFTTSLVANGALATNYNLTLPAVLPTVGPQALVSDTAGNLNWTTALNATTTTSFAGANNVTTATNVTGLTMVSTSYASTTLYVLITGAVNQSAIYTLTAILTPTGTYNFTYYAQGDDTGIVFTMNTVTGQVLYTSPSIAGFVSLAFSWLTPKTITNFLPASTTSVFNAAAPQTISAPVTGLVVNIPSVTMTLYVLVNATTNLTQVVTLTIYTKGTANNYALAQTNVGDDTGIVFLIGTATGQVQYTSPSFVGWTSTSIQWTNPATLTTTPTTLGSLALTGPLQVTNAGITVGSLNSIVPTSSLSTTTGSSLTLASQTVQDTATAANGTLANFQSVYLGIPTLSAANTTVTTSTASTLTIAGPPVAGTNETIATAYALNIQNGNSIFAGVANFNRLAVQTKDFLEFQMTTNSNGASGSSSPVYWVTSPTNQTGFPTYTTAMWTNSGSTFTPGVIGLYLVVWNARMDTSGEVLIVRNSTLVAAFATPAMLALLGSTPGEFVATALFVVTSTSDFISFGWYNSSGATANYTTTLNRNYLRITRL